jgi:hypothetical protein
VDDMMVPIWAVLLIGSTIYSAIQLVSFRAMEREGISLRLARRREYWRLASCAVSGFGLLISLTDPDPTTNQFFEYGLAPILLVTLVIARWVTDEPFLEG